MSNTKLRFNRWNDHKGVYILRPNDSVSDFYIERNLITKELYIAGQSLEKQDIKKLIKFLEEIVK